MEEGESGSQEMRASRSKGIVNRLQTGVVQSDSGGKRQSQNLSIGL